MVIDGTTYSYNAFFKHAFSAGYVGKLNIEDTDTSMAKPSVVLKDQGLPPIVLNKGGKNYLIFYPNGYSIPTKGEINVRIVNKFILSKSKV